MLSLVLGLLLLQVSGQHQLGNLLFDYPLGFSETHHDEELVRLNNFSGDLILNGVTGKGDAQIVVVLEQLGNNTLQQVVTKQLGDAYVFNEKRISIDGRAGMMLLTETDVSELHMSDVRLYLVDGKDLYRAIMYFGAATPKQVDQLMDRFKQLVQSLKFAK